MEEGNLWHICNKLENNYYLFVSEDLIWRTPDFEESEQLMQIETTPQKLFIDHKGNIYVCRDSYIKSKNETTFVLPKNQ